MADISLAEWNAFLSNHPSAHILQTGEWGVLKSAFGWEPVRFVAGDYGAQILFRRLPLGFTLAYIPKGPVMDCGPRIIEDRPLSTVHVLWPEIDCACRSRHAIFLKVEPDAWEDSQNLAPAAPFPGFTSARYSIQPRRTIVLDLRGSEEDILSRMKQKCRYNIHLAERKGVTVRVWDDIDRFHQMMTVTGVRNEFGVHSLEYYRRAYDLLHEAGLGELLVAEYDGRPLAALMVCARGKRSWYLYGASTDEERNRMPSHLLQWEAMCWARRRGAEEYDLWGVPDEDEVALEAGFESCHDGLWGVYRFKRGFGGEVKRAVAALDKVYNPLLYRAYQAFWES